MSTFNICSVEKIRKLAIWILFLPGDMHVCPNNCGYMVLIGAILRRTYYICFRGEKKKYIFWTNILTGALEKMTMTCIYIFSCKNRR